MATLSSISNSDVGIYSGDTVSLSTVRDDLGPSYPHYLSDDLRVRAGQTSQVLDDAVDNTAVASIRHDSRRYLAWHSLWYITLANERDRRLLHFGDTIVLRHAGTNRYLSVSSEGALTLAVPDSMGNLGPKMHFILHPAGISFSSRPPLLSASSIHLVSAHLASQYVTTVPKPVVSPPPIAKEHLSTTSEVTPETRLSSDLSRYARASTSREETINSIYVCRLEEIALTDLKRNEQLPFGMSEVTNSRIAELQKGLKALKLKLQKLDNMLSSAELVNTTVSVDAHLSPHDEVFLSGGAKATAWTIALGGSSHVPSGLIRGGDVISLGTLKPRPPNALVQDTQPEDSLIYAVLAASERDLTMTTELYYRRQQLYTSALAVKGYKKRLFEVDKAIPKQDPVPLTLSQSSHTAYLTPRLEKEKQEWEHYIVLPTSNPSSPVSLDSTSAFRLSASANQPGPQNEPIYNLGCDLDIPTLVAYSRSVQEMTRLALTKDSLTSLLQSVPSSSEIVPQKTTAGPSSTPPPLTTSPFDGYERIVGSEVPMVDIRVAARVLDTNLSKLNRITLLRFANTIISTSFLRSQPSPSRHGLTLDPSCNYLVTPLSCCIAQTLLTEVRLLMKLSAEVAVICAAYQVGIDIASKYSNDPNKKAAKLYQLYKCSDALEKFNDCIAFMQSYFATPNRYPSYLPSSTSSFQSSGNLPPLDALQVTTLAGTSPTAATSSSGPDRSPSLPSSWEAAKKGLPEPVLKALQSIPSPSYEDIRVSTVTVSSPKASPPSSSTPSRALSLNSSSSPLSSFADHSPSISSPSTPALGSSDSSISSISLMINQSTWLDSLSNVQLLKDPKFQKRLGSMTILDVLKEQKLSLAVCTLSILNMDKLPEGLNAMLNNWAKEKCTWLERTISRLSYTYPRPTILCPPTCNEIRPPLTNGNSLLSTVSYNDLATLTRSFSSGLQRAPIQPSFHQRCYDCLRNRHTSLTAVPTNVTFLRSCKPLPPAVDEHAIIPENTPYQPSSLWMIEVVDPNPVGSYRYQALSYPKELASAPLPSDSRDVGLNTFGLREHNRRSRDVTYQGSLSPPPPLCLSAYRSSPLNCAPLTSSTLIRLRNILTGEYLAVKVGIAEDDDNSEDDIQDSTDVIEGNEDEEVDEDSEDGESDSIEQVHLAKARDGYEYKIVASSPLGADGSEESVDDMKRDEDKDEDGEEAEEEDAGMSVISDESGEADGYEPFGPSNEASQVTDRDEFVCIPLSLAADAPASMKGTDQFVRDRPFDIDLDRNKLISLNDMESGITIDINRTKQFYEKAQASSSRPDRTTRPWGADTLPRDRQLSDIPTSPPPAVDVDIQDNIHQTLDSREENLRYDERDFNQNDSNYLLTRVSPPSATTCNNEVVTRKYIPVPSLWEAERWVKGFEVACRRRNLDRPDPVYATVFTADPDTLSKLGALVVDTRSRNEVELEELGARSNSHQLTLSNQQPLTSTPSQSTEVSVEQKRGASAGRSNDSDVDEVDEGWANASRRRLSEGSLVSEERKHEHSSCSILDVSTISLKLHRPEGSHFSGQSRLDSRVPLLVKRVCHLSLYLLLSPLTVLLSASILYYFHLPRLSSYLQNDTLSTNVVRQVQERRGVLLTFETALANFVREVSLSSLNIYISMLLYHSLSIGIVTHLFPLA